MKHVLGGIAMLALLMVSPAEADGPSGQASNNFNPFANSGNFNPFANSNTEFGSGLRQRNSPATVGPSRGNVSSGIIDAWPSTIAVSETRLVEIRNPDGIRNLDRNFNVGDKCEIKKNDVLKKMRDLDETHYLVEYRAWNQGTGNMCPTHTEIKMTKVRYKAHDRVDSK